MLNRERSTSRKAVSPVRVVAAGVAALVLLGSSFNAVSGGSLAGYGGGGGGGDDDDGGLSGGAIAGIVVGGGAAVYFVAAEAEKKRKEDAEEGKPSSSAGNRRKVESVRVTPQNVRLERGAAQDFQVQVRYAGEQSWENVTGNSQASLKMVDPSGRLAQMDGAKSVFTAPIDVKGGPTSAKLIATFAGAQASTTIAVQ